MNRVREAVEKIEREARRLMPGEPCEDRACQDCEWDRALLAAIHAALLACDEANERAEQKDKEVFALRNRIVALNEQVEQAEKREREYAVARAAFIGLRCRPGQSTLDVVCDLDDLDEYFGRMP
jgi:hypothetical protein